MPVAFDTTQITSPGNYSVPRPGDPCHPLAATAHPPAVACTERTRADGRNVETQEELAYAVLDGGAGTASRGSVVTPAMAVRRLTPLECLRLQGYPDDWLDGLGLADSTKYRMVGNSIAVPVVEWIARRLVAASE